MLLGLEILHLKKNSNPEQYSSLILKLESNQVILSDLWYEPFSQNILLPNNAGRPV